MITTRMITVDEAVERGATLGPMIQRALAKGQGERDFNDYASLMISGEAHLWLVEEDEEVVGVALTKFNQYPQYKSLHIAALTGDRWFEWGPMAHERLEEFAKETGCEKIEVWGRKGWERALRAIPEYTHAYSVFVMEV